ncbi:hypothetical protein BC629DRAFT_544191 [Irpex lacteus]|nr:hypothetical protein BC629DRAFT_544191 [Irpex lacteus]
MNDEPTSSSSHSATPRPLTISDLPDEMLSSIIKELGESYDVRVYIYNDVRRGDWPSCALVCRRWYRITLPHLFRYMQLPVRERMDYWEDTAEFRRFLEEKPAIARCVQGLIIGQMSVDIYDFDAILDTLDNLRYLEFGLTHFDLDEKDKDWSEWLSTIPRDRTIAKLVYCPDR